MTTKMLWDQVGERLYETGTDHAALFMQDAAGKYVAGVPFNGLTKVTESPEGAEETKLYADNGKYLSLLSAEEFKGTIEAYTYPTEFEAADGSAAPEKGVSVGQQARKPFGFVYRTIVGNDVEANDHGYKLHVVYGAKVSPSERGYETVNDSPAAVTFSWAFTTTPVAVPGFKPSATLTFDSTVLESTVYDAIEAAIYDGESLPDPAALIKIVKDGLATPKP